MEDRDMELAQMLSMMGQPGATGTLTNPAGGTNWQASIKMPFGGAAGATPFRPAAGLDPATQPAAGLDPANPAPATAQPGMVERFGNYMKSDSGKAMLYNVGNIAGAMAGGPMGNLAQNMAQGGLYGLRQKETMDRADERQNKVLAAMLGGKTADFR